MNTNAEKREFLGGLILTTLAKVGTEKVVGAALSKIAANKNIPMNNGAVAPATEAVTEKLVKETQARLEHKLDIEPHTSSRNLWGSLVVMIGAADVIYKLWTDDQMNTITDYLGPIGIILGGLTPIYSRFIAKKPLFR